MQDFQFEWNLCKKFDERFNDLMAFKTEFGHCNVRQTPQSKNNEHYSLGMWYNRMRQCYKVIQEGRSPHDHTLSKANMQRLENAGFEWKLSQKFDERFNDLMAFKTEFGHCDAPESRNNKHYSLCSVMRQSYKAIQEGRSPHHNLSKADIQRLEKAGFEWRLNKIT